MQPDQPTPDREMLRRVCAHLEPRRLVTTELYVTPPQYVRLSCSVAVEPEPGAGEETLRRNIERSVIVRQVRSRDVDPKAQVTEADVRNEYEHRKGTDFTRKATVHLMEIVLKGEGAAEVANTVVARLKKGEDFETLAREVSVSGSKTAGGDLGRVEPSDLNPALSSAIADLRPGEVSAPVQVEGGYWILKVRERMADEVTPFEQVRAVAEQRRISMRLAAYLLAVRRVADANATRGIYP